MPGRRLCRGFACLLLSVSAVAVNRCGSTFSDAAASCGALCPTGVDSECPSGQHCFASVVCTGSGDKRCGTSWSAAGATCGALCPGGLDSECSTASGEHCYASVTCAGSSDNRCGTSWSDAGATCGALCPAGLDSGCPSGQHCYASVTCTGNNRCGTSWSAAATTCGALCPGGLNSECPATQQCYASVTCSAPPSPSPTATPSSTRQPTRRPTQKPTRKPTPKPTAAAGANRCGATSADAADTCGRLCPSGVDGECPPAQKCYRSITCSSTVPACVQGAPISALSSCRYKGCTYYTVMAGDYLFKIAQLRGTTVNALAALNPWLAVQGLNVIAPGQQVLVEACAAAGLPAKGRPNPELVAVAQLFTSASIDPLVAKYTTAATAANQKALSDALHKNWATATGRGKLLQLQQSDSTFAALMSAYGTDRATTCARFRQQGAMASTLADCYCDATQPQLYCDAKIKAAFEAGPGAKLKRKLEEEPEGPGMSFAREGERRAKKSRTQAQAGRYKKQRRHSAQRAGAAAFDASAAVAWQQRSAGQSERSLALVDVGPPSTTEPQPPDLCTTGVSALTSGAGVDGFLSNVARRGGCLTPVSCSKTVLLWGFPFTASLSLSACVPYVAYANVNGYKTMQVCAQSGQCSSALTTTPSEQVAGLVGMNAGFTMSLCFGWAEAAAALKFFGVGACVSISIKLFPVKGWVVIAAEVLIIVVGFALNFYVQAFDEAKDYFNSLYGICSPANCKTNLYCQMRQGDINGNFEIKVTFLFWQKTLWSSPNFFTPRGCPSQPALPPSNAEFKVMSVYTTDWAQYRGVVTAEYPRPPWCAQYAYTPSNLDPALFTHINYAFAKIEPNTFKVVNVEWNDDALLQQLQVHRSRGVKVLVSIGGWSFSRADEAFKGTASDRIFPAMASTAANRAAFIQSAIAYATSAAHPLDGIDLDWEYPNYDGTAPAERINFTLLLQEMYAACKGAGLLLTAATAALQADTHYELSQIYKYLDFINLMTYDFNGGSFPGTTVANANAPIVDCLSRWCANTKAADIDSALSSYINAGVPANKIVLGLATYSRTFTLAAPAGSLLPGVAAAAGAPPGGDCTISDAVLSWYELKRQMASAGTAATVDNASMSAYATYGPGKQYWASFDNQETHRRKACWAASKGVLGLMAWDGEMDDNLELLRSIRTNWGTGRDCSNIPAPTCGAPPAALKCPSPPDGTGGGAGTGSPGSNRCGTSWSAAGTTCGALCPGGTDSECPATQHCYASVTCSGRKLTTTAAASGAAALSKLLTSMSYDSA